MRHLTDSTAGLRIVSGYGFEQLPVERCCFHDLDSHIRQAEKSVNKINGGDEDSDYPDLESETDDEDEECNEEEEKKELEEDEDEEDNGSA
jgi:hypothetical protein